MKLLDNIIARPVMSPSNMGAGPPFMHGRTIGTMDGSDPHTADGTFQSMITNVYRKHGPVASAITARQLLISQVRFQWRRDSTSGRPGELWGNRDLRILERPGSMTRTTMLSRMEQDVSLAGNAYIARKRQQLFRLPPDKVMFLFTSDSDPTWVDDQPRLPYDAEVAALVYNPNNNQHDKSGLEVFMPGEFAHWAPEPDPEYWWRGASWVTSLINEIALDLQIQDHQSKFFENAGTPNLVFIMDPQTAPDEVKAYAELVNATHAGSGNAHKNMFLGGGQDVKVVGQDFSKIGFKDLEGGLETRVAVRSRLPVVMLGVREGLSGSALTTGNYGAARRLYADGTFSPTVDTLCESLESIVPPPGGSELSHDPKRVLFLQEDQKDAAEIQGMNAATIGSYITAGFTAESAELAVRTGDTSKLVHSGLVSVQLQPPGSDNRSMSNRTIMGRLGRYNTVQDIDIDRLTAGLSHEETETVRTVVHMNTDGTIETLRATMLATLNGATP